MKGEVRCVGGEWEVSNTRLTSGGMEGAVVTIGDKGGGTAPETATWTVG